MKNKKTFQYLAVVSVAQCVPDEDLDMEDLESDALPGEHQINLTLDYIASEEEAREIILDEFHEEVPISCLDDWDIDVKFLRRPVISWGKGAKSINL